ncbi:11906_t:CDS:2, partial [Funneliformis geosporum]
MSDQHYNKSSEIYQQYKEIEVLNQALPEETEFIKCEKYLNTFYHSRPINTKQITQLLQNSKETITSKNYPSKTNITKIKREYLTEKISGELIIQDFPNLQKIDFSSFRKGKLTKLKIINCPQLRKLNCESNQLEELDIDEVSHNVLDNSDYELESNSEEWSEDSSSHSETIVYQLVEKPVLLKSYDNNCQKLRKEYEEYLEEEKKGPKISVETIKKIKEIKNDNSFDEEGIELNFDSSAQQLSIDWLIEKTNEKELIKRYKKVVLKILNDSQNTTTEFLQEVANHRLFDATEGIVPCHGISQDPKTKNYLIVMQYIPTGNLRQYLQNYRTILSFGNKLSKLCAIASGLKVIHNKGLVHKDFHSGNILSDYTECYITDLGLCCPASETKKENIFGVIPYVAPEVLNKKPYTSASDIYSFSVIAYEMVSGLPPYCHKKENDRYCETVYDLNL